MTTTLEKSAPGGSRPAAPVRRKEHTWAWGGLGGVRPPQNPKYPTQTRCLGKILTKKRVLRPFWAIFRPASGIFRKVALPRFLELPTFGKEAWPQQLFPGPSSISPPAGWCHLCGGSAVVLCPSPATTPSSHEIDSWRIAVCSSAALYRKNGVGQTCGRLKPDSRFGQRVLVVDEWCATDHIARLRRDNAQLLHVAVAEFPQFPLFRYASGILYEDYPDRRSPIFHAVFFAICKVFKAHTKKFGLFCTTYKEKNRYFSCIFILKTAFWRFKIAEILSSTYKIEHFSRFLGQNTYFNMFLVDILNRYFKGFYMPKNTFFEDTKKFSVQKNTAFTPRSSGHHFSQDAKEV